jgi:HNH endonuclease
MTARNQNPPGERMAKGFVYVHKPEHPHAFGAYVYRCRLVMEEHLGRLLTKEEKLIHINGVKDDDRLENLLLFPNEREYDKYSRARV